MPSTPLIEKSWSSKPYDGFKLQCLIIDLEKEQVKEIWSDDMDGNKAPTAKPAAMKAMKARKKMMTMKAIKSMKSFTIGMKSLMSMNTAPMKTMKLPNAMKTKKA